MTPNEFKSSLTTRYLELDLVKKMFFFANEVSNPGDLDVNQLDKPNLLHYFLYDWEAFSKEKKN